MLIVENVQSCNDPLELMDNIIRILIMITNYQTIGNR